MPSSSDKVIIASQAPLQDPITSQKSHLKYPDIRAARINLGDVIIWSITVFFICSGHKPVIKYTTCESLLPFCGCCFTFFMTSVEAQTFSVLMKLNSCVTS